MNAQPAPKPTLDSAALAETVVLIPAAGRVPDGLIALSNIKCPAMVPVAGRPVIYWTLRYLESLGLRRFVIAVAERGMFVEEFVRSTVSHDAEVEFLVPSVSAGVGRTLCELAERAEGQSALVVLGDTHFQFSDPGVLRGSRPTVLVEEVAESYRWCVAETDPDGCVTALRDKQRDLPGRPQALIGVYYFPRLAAFRAAARGAVDDTPPGRPTEMSRILERLRRDEPLWTARAGLWLDCGNPDRQASSHRSLLQARAFNELHIDSVLGTITKRSQNAAKLIDEINYLRLLPKDLAVLFPRLVDYSTGWQDPWLKLEYYGYPTLAEVFLFENVDPGIWQRVFEHLRAVIEQGFMRHPRPLGRKALVEMYLTKTRERLAALGGNPALAALTTHRGELSINGRPTPNLPLLWERIEAAVERLADDAQGAVIHGDLCFSNILYDLRSGVCKLIDPRGSFGGAGIYGDPRYDVAKLFHSVAGLYDFIVNDLFSVAVDGPEARLALRCLPQHAAIRERFERVFFPQFSREQVTLLAGLLFVSMPALHYDAPQRQLAMYLRGLQLLDAALAGRPWTDDAVAPRAEVAGA